MHPTVDLAASSQLATPVSIHRNPHPIRIAERDCLGLLERNALGPLLPRFQKRELLQNAYNRVHNLAPGNFLPKALTVTQTERHEEAAQRLPTADLALIGASPSTHPIVCCSGSHGIGGPGANQIGPSFRPELGPVLTVPPGITIQRVRGPDDSRPRPDNDGSLAVLAASPWKGRVDFGSSRVRGDRRVEAKSCTTQGKTGSDTKVRDRSYSSGQECCALTVDFFGEGGGGEAHTFVDYQSQILHPVEVLLCGEHPVKSPNLFSQSPLNVLVSQ